MADQVKDVKLTKEECSMVRLAIGLKIASLKRAQKSAEPGFDELYTETLDKYNKLSLLF